MKHRRQLPITVMHFRAVCSSNHSDASAVNPAQVEMDVDGLGGRVDWWGIVFHGEIVRM